MPKDDLDDVLNVFKEAIQTPESEKRLENVRKQNLRNLAEFPSEMSCVTAFDEMFSCYSVGGQIRNYYRYGEFNNCSEAYQKFSFCLTNRASRVSEDEKKIEVQKYYKKQYLMKKAKGSSDDVWEQR